MNRDVLYSAAHAEFPDTEPLGGGKAVADWLIREWREDSAFALHVLSPHSLRLPLTKPLTDQSELEYAGFCRQFERAATTAILKHDPHDCVVLSNDISEGPDFSALGTRGYRIVTIFHVDVLEFFTRFYLRNVVRPETVAKFRAFALLPDVLRLVYQKQFDCVRHSAKIVVPSEPMRDTIRRCYPWCALEKIVVLPWGAITASAETGDVIDVSENEFVVMTMSRLSPEKGIERLLRALPHVHANGCKLRVLICGAPAYMKGRAYERKLKRLASRLGEMNGARVEFAGHVTGPRKAALLHRADVFVSPSHHESYGLAIAEAVAAGCQVISHPHYGATGTVVDCEDSRVLAGAIGKMIAAGRTVKTPSPSSARATDNAATRLANLLVELAGHGG